MTVPYSKRMQGYGSDFIKEMFAAARNPDLISFAGGAPAPELYPLEAFRAASDKAFDEWGRTMMAYDGAEGILPLREIIANERMAQMGVNVARKISASSAVPSRASTSPPACLSMRATPLSASTLPTWVRSIPLALSTPTMYRCPWMTTA